MVSQQVAGASAETERTHPVSPRRQGSDMTVQHISTSTHGSVQSPIGLSTGAGTIVDLCVEKIRDRVGDTKPLCQTSLAGNKSTATGAKRVCCSQQRTAVGPKRREKLATKTMMATPADAQAQARGLGRQQCWTNPAGRCRAQSLQALVLTRISRTPVLRNEFLFGIIQICPAIE